MILSETMVAESDIKVLDVKRHMKERTEISGSPQFGSVCV